MRYLKATADLLRSFAVYVAWSVYDALTAHMLRRGMILTAATAWTLYDKAKKKIGNGTIQLGTNVLKVQLHTSASNASTSTLSTAASVSNEVANGNGYTTGGKSLASVVWTVGASASQYKLDSADPIWTATGGNIANIKFAVIKNSAGQALCWSRLTTAQFTLTQNNTLTIQMNAAGIFTLT